MIDTIRDDEIKSYLVDFLNMCGISSINYDIHHFYGGYYMYFPNDKVIGILDGRVRVYNMYSKDEDEGYFGRFEDVDLLSLKEWSADIIESG